MNPSLDDPVTIAFIAGAVVGFLLVLWVIFHFRTPRAPRPDAPLKPDQEWWELHRRIDNLPQGPNADRLRLEFNAELKRVESALGPERAQSLSRERCAATHRIA